MWLYWVLFAISIICGIFGLKIVFKDSENGSTTKGVLQNQDLDTYNTILDKILKEKIEET